MSEQYVEVYFDEIIDTPSEEATLFKIGDEDVWIPNSLHEITEPGIMEIPEQFTFENGLI